MSSHEPSPSTGARGTAAAMDAVYGLGEYVHAEISDGDETLQEAVIHHTHLKDFHGVSS